MNISEKLQTPIDKFLNSTIAVLGSTGAGKTNTVAVLIEEMLPHIPMTIIDPEGEYWGLKEQLEILVVGQSPNADITVDASQARTVAEFSYKNSVPVILDLLELKRPEANEFVSIYLDHLFDLAIKEPKHYNIVIDETHEFAPQHGKSSAKESIITISKRGRKRGLGLIVSSQRSASVDKDVLTQSRIRLLHRVYYANDINLYKTLIPKTERAESDEMIYQLNVGDAIVIMENESHGIHRIRKRDTHHVGIEDNLNANMVKPVNKDTLESLQELLSNSTPDATDTPEVILLKSRISHLESKLEEQKKHYQELLSDMESELIRVKKESGTGIQESLDLWKRRSIERQKQQVERLINEVQSLPAYHLDILMYLTNNAEMKLDTKQLASILGLAYNSISGKPPLKLIKLELLSREGRPAKYFSIAIKTLERRFPDVDAMEILSRFFRREKETA